MRIEPGTKNGRKKKSPSSDRNATVIARMERHSISLAFEERYLPEMIFA